MLKGAAMIGSFNMRYSQPFTGEDFGLEDALHSTENSYVFVS
jgi:hypothetical protein